MINFFQKNNYILYIIKFSLWLLAFLAILEIFTRSFILKLPYQYFASGLGLVPVNNAVTIWGIEGFGVTHFLSNGEIYTPHQSGASVVVLGDSFTQALQVSDNQKYVSVAENILYGREMKMDLHNLGAPGSSIADYVYKAPFIIKKYSPDVVVVQLSTSDFAESLDVSRQNYFVHSGMSLELVHNENYFVFDLNFQNMIRSTGLGSLAVYKLTPIVKEQRARLAVTNQPQPVSPRVMHNDLNPREIEIQINSLKDAYPNIELVFLVIPNIPVVQDGILIWNSESDNSLIEVLDGIFNLPLLYPRDGFVELYTAHKKFPRGFFNTLPNNGHLNSDGNFAVGVALADYLEGIAQ